MRTSSPLVALGCVILSACATGFPPTQAAQRARSDGRLMPPEPVTDHVWVMRQPDRLWAVVIGNVVIIEQTDGVVLVDSGGSIADGRDVSAGVAAVTKKPIKAIAITHWHNDHPLGVPGILQSFPNARIISTAVTRDYIRTETKVGIGKPDVELDEKRRQRAQQVAADFAREAARTDSPASLRAEYAIEAAWTLQRVERQMGAYAMLPTEAVDDRLLLDDALAPIELRFFGTANTHGDLMAWLPRQKVVATGDAVVAPTPYGFDVSAKPWLDVLRRVDALPFEILIPGHGKVQRGRDYLRTLEWSMKDIVDRATAAAAAGLTKDDAFARFDPQEQQSRFQAKDPWVRKWLNDYWLEGMFGTAYDEAKGIAAPGK
jgi:glyoxylase-like metal-dependent hydrolase (beta-lactamase superfamily II)